METYEQREPSAALQDDRGEQPQPSRRRWVVVFIVLVIAVAVAYVVIRTRGRAGGAVTVEPTVAPPAEVRSPTVAGAIVSAKGDGTLVLPYRNEELRFSLEFPLDWEGYRVTSTPTGNRMLVTFEYPQADDLAAEDGRVAFTVYAYPPGTILPTDVRVLAEEGGILYGFSETKASAGARTAQRAQILEIIRSFRVLPIPPSSTEGTDEA